jgi:sugar phosphate permease
VANWFIKKRGLALGILSTAIGISGFVLYLINWLIGLCGWRQTLAILGIGLWVIGIPSALVVRTRPETLGILPDGRRGVPRKPDESSGISYRTAQERQEYTVRAALKTKAFWILSLVVTISAGSLHAVIVHIMPYLISIHFSRETAGLTASLLVLVSTVGRFTLGWLTTRVDTRYLMALALLLQALGMLALAEAQGMGLAILFVVLFGPGYGGVITLRLTMQAEYFGRKAFGSIQGIMIAILISGTVASPFLTGFCFDTYGAYRPAWLFMTALLLVATPLSILSKPPREKI